MNTANPNAAADAVSDESEDLIAELARIVAKDAHATRRDVPREEPKAPPPIPQSARAAEPEAPATPAADPEAILSEGFRTIGEPTLQAPSQTTPPAAAPAAETRQDGGASPLGRLRPADLGFGAESAPAAPKPAEPQAGKESGPSGEFAFDFGLSGGQPGEPQAEGEGGYKSPADDFDPIADIIASAEAVEEPETSQDVSEPPAALQQAPPTPEPVARPEPVVDVAPPAPEPAPPPVPAPEQSAPQSDRFETAPGMRQKPAAAPQKRAASADPLDEIERLIAETTAIEFPSAAAQAAQAHKADEPEPQAPARPDASPEPVATREAPTPPVESEQARVLDEAAATAEAAIAASVTHSMAGDHAEEEARAEAAASAAFTRTVGRLIMPAGAAVLVLALVGGGAWWYFNQDGSLFGEAPVVTAQNTTVKQDPPTEAAIDAGDPADSIVFTQLAGESGGTPADEQIVSRDQSQQADADSLTRVITPESDTGGLANRRVRTVTVRADGTIVSGDEATAGVEPLPAVRPNVPDVPGAPVIEDGDADSIGAVLNALAEQEAGTPAEEAANAQATASTGVGNVAPIPIPRPANLGAAGGQTAAEPQQTAVATDQVTQPRVVTPVVITPAPSTNTDEPVSLLGEPTTTASIPVTSTSNSPFYVQLASQPSEALAVATAGDIEQRFASVLGGVDLEIQRADLGDRGVYYRVKAPAQSLGEANGLCNLIKAAGGDCFVRAD